MTNAIVFVLTKYLETDGAACTAYCTARGYSIVALVRDDWDGALNALCTFAASVIVVANMDHLDEGCTPRMEVATELPVVQGPRGKRSRMLNRRSVGA